jgi:hypothetical protein
MQIIETVICETLGHVYTYDVDANVDNPTYAEEEDFLFTTESGGTIQHSDDIYKDVKAIRPFNDSLSIPPPPYLETFIHSYKDLCKAWYIYSLSGKKIFSLESKKVQQLKIRSIKSLRSTLGVLTVRY